MARKKAVVVGAGNVGATTAQRIAEGGLADVVLTDVVEHIAEGKALDLAEAAPVIGSDCRVTGVTTPKEGAWPAGVLEKVAGADIIVITAGLPRRPGMDRSDLLKVNAAIVGSVTENVTKASPDATLIVVSNPLDTMTYLAHKRSGFPSHRVMGMAGVLDSARFQAFISMELGVSVKDVRAMVLGGHGDSMVPLPGHSNVNGVPITALLPGDRLEALIDRTRKGGAEIVNLLKTGSAYYAPAASVFAMAQAILLDERRLLPVCARLEGQYGVHGVWVGVPAILGARGIERILELELSPGEAAALQDSADKVKQDIDLLDSLLA